LFSFWHFLASFPFFLVLKLFLFHFILLFLNLHSSFIQFLFLFPFYLPLLLFSFLLNLFFSLLYFFILPLNLQLKLHFLSFLLCFVFFFFISQQLIMTLLQCHYLLNFNNLLNHIEYYAIVKHPNECYITTILPFHNFLNAWTHIHLFQINFKFSW
jgi:hypothetical protein